ncbi:MAG: rhombosortase [Desulfurivibrionaceae bacterium]
MSRFPAITLVMASAALVIHAVPQLQRDCVYDRHLVLAGQWWRLFTAPFVHFSVSHLCWNLLVLVAAGTTVELEGYRRFGWVALLSIAVPGVLFLASKPELARYGGLSSVAVGATAYLCLHRAARLDGGRWLWMALFAVLLGKILAESLLAAPLFARSAEVPFMVLPSAHLIGLVVATLLFFTEKHRRWRAKEQPKGLTF